MGELNLHTLMPSTSVPGDGDGEEGECEYSEITIKMVDNGYIVEYDESISVFTDKEEVHLYVGGLL